MLIVLFLLLARLTVHAQTAEEVYNAYLDFNLSRLQGETQKALEQGENLLPSTNKLTDKQRVNFYYSIGNLYENDSQSINAQKYYEMVAAAAPDYYIVHRALGYLYAKQADEIGEKLNAAKTNAAENKRLTALYNAAVKKALPHLEKAQACEPADDTLSLIRLLYKNSHDTQGAASLNQRLTTLSKNCVDLLTDK